MKRIQAILLLAFVLVGNIAAGAAEPASKPIAITNVRIFDGARVIPKGTVVVRGRTIAASRSTACGWRLRFPDG